MNLREFLKKSGYNTIDELTAMRIDQWAKWYRGFVDEFHRYSIFNGTEKVFQRRASLKMAKYGCEFWASLLWNDECSISVNGEDRQKALDAVFEANGFSQKTTNLIERAFALGTGAYVIAPDPAIHAKIAYVDAQNVFPLEWDGDDCKSCAFSSVDVRNDGTRILYLMLHLRQPGGGYRIENHFFDAGKSGDLNNLKEIDPPDGIEPEMTSKVKRFALIRPNISDNLNDCPSPMGLSVYANSLDILRAIDLAFDGIVTAMKIGRPRIAVSAEALKAGKDGIQPVFDANDAVFYYLAEPEPGEKTLIHDITTEYRAKEFELSLQAQLTVFSQHIGLGEKAFRWENGSVATATQVISENTTMLRTMAKHQHSLRLALTGVVQAVFDCLEQGDPGEITVEFDDSAVRDKDAERMRFWQMVVAGRFPFWRYLHEYEDYSEVDAKAIASEAQTQQRAAQDAFPPAE